MKDRGRRRCEGRTIRGRSRGGGAGGGYRRFATCGKEGEVSHRGQDSERKPSALLVPAKLIEVLERLPSVLKNQHHLFLIKHGPLKHTIQLRYPQSVQLAQLLGVVPRLISDLVLGAVLEGDHGAVERATKVASAVMTSFGIGLDREEWVGERRRRGGTRGRGPRWAAGRLV